MEYVAIVTALALLQLFMFSFQVGQARQKHGVSAPAMSGAPEFERVCRVHQNTLEQLVMFIPSLWIFATYISAEIGAAIGLIFIVGRQIYRSAYVADPSKRGLGFAIGAIAMMTLLTVGVGGAVGHLL